MSIVPAEEALRELIEGNRRFLTGEMTIGRNSRALRKKFASGQQPIAVVAACSDSRVAPEILFDQDLGRLFVVRTAGHVLREIGMGSMEYAVEHCGVRLAVVMAHARCGAVEAAMKPEMPPGHMARLADAIRPAVQSSIENSNPAADWGAACRENLKLALKRLRRESRVLAQKVRDGDLLLIGAFYDLDTGQVEFLPDALE